MAGNLWKKLWVAGAAFLVGWRKMLRRGLPQSPCGDSSLPEGAFWPFSLLQYQTCSWNAVLQGMHRASLREGGGSRLRLTEGEREATAPPITFFSRILRRNVDKNSRV